jgi:hypothetical protein
MVGAFIEVIAGSSVSCLDRQCEGPAVGAENSLCAANDIWLVVREPVFPGAADSSMQIARAESQYRTQT